MKNKRKIKKGGAYIKNNDVETIVKLDADLEELKEEGFNLLEKHYTEYPVPKTNIYFNAIISMLANLTEITCIASEECISGFVFHIKSSNSYFKKMVGNQEEDIYELILKFGILSKKKTHITFGHLYETIKETITPNNVYNEARMQQQIYNISSMTTYQICPSVLDVSIFESINARTVLIELLQNVETDNFTENILDEKL